MRSFVFSGLVAAAVVVGSLAQADVIVGKVKSIDHSAETVTLQNGSEYKFGSYAEHDGFLNGYLAGDAVKIVTEGSTNVAVTMAPDFSGAVSGKVKSVNIAAQTVTLENGITYKFTTDKKGTLDGYKTGDRVKITAHQIGASHWGETISPMS